MPKIDVNEDIFHTLSGLRWASKEEFEGALVCAKAELDSDYEPTDLQSDGSQFVDGENLATSERTLRIELNDTNRPDLWGTAGLARQLRFYSKGKMPDTWQGDYAFFSSPGSVKNTTRKVIAEKSVIKVRPYITGFIASGKEVTDPMLRDIIQTQEKLAWNFGRRRRSISMGIYRAAVVKWPVIYRAVDPDSVSFVPLQWEAPLTLREILKQHPKGKEFAFILENEPIHPLLLDSQGQILSFPPIINSADLGAVQVGDSELFIEFTGTDQRQVTLATSIMACDLADMGFAIEPVEINYEFDTPLGQKCVTPFYFQEPVFCSLGRIEKFLGVKLNSDECLAALAKMGVNAEKAFDAEKGGNAKGSANGGAKTEGIKAWPPCYRNDFLHAADVMEEVMMGMGISAFKPERPSDFTIGRLTELTLFSRRVRELMAGLGFQEMIYNYLGSRKDFVEKMRLPGDRIVRISNPMTENYEYVRDGMLASLLTSESVSGHSVFPHRSFEIGKVTYWDKDEVLNTATRQYLGFLQADREANFNTAVAQIQTLFYYLAREYDVEEKTDPRFIPGRAASIVYKGRPIGIFGEIHPEVLENWGVTMPCTAGEIDIEALI